MNEASNKVSESVSSHQVLTEILNGIAKINSLEPRGGGQLTVDVDGQVISGLAFQYSLETPTLNANQKACLVTIGVEENARIKNHLLLERDGEFTILSEDSNVIYGVILKIYKQVDAYKIATSARADLRGSNA